MCIVQARMRYKFQQKPLKKIYIFKGLVLSPVPCFIKTFSHLEMAVIWIYKVAPKILINRSFDFGRHITTNYQHAFQCPAVTIKIMAGKHDIVPIISALEASIWFPSFSENSKLGIDTYDRYFAYTISSEFPMISIFSLRAWLLLPLLQHLECMQIRFWDHHLEMLNIHANSAD